MISQLAHLALDSIDRHLLSSFTTQPFCYDAAACKHSADQQKTDILMAGPAPGASPSAGSSRWYRPVYGFHPHPPALMHRMGAKFLGGTMVFWILYRGYHDGAALLGAHPWEHHHGGHDSHDHGDGHH